MKLSELQAETETYFDRATAQIISAIQRNMLTSSTMFGKQCVINLILKVGEGRGDSTVCQAVVVAIRKTGTLPMPKEPDLNKKLQDIKLTFKPM